MFTPGSDNTTVLLAVLELQPAELAGVDLNVSAVIELADISAGDQFGVGAEFRLIVGNRVDHILVDRAPPWFRWSRDTVNP